MINELFQNYIYNYRQIYMKRMDCRKGKNMNEIKGILTVLCLLTVSIPVAGGGVGSTFTNDSVCTQMGEVASWTYMVYCVGDAIGNDPDRGKVFFDELMLNKMNLMELSGSTTDVNIVIQADDYNIWGGDKGSFGGTRRYYIQHDENPAELADYTLNENVWYLEEQNMGDSDTLIDFLSWATINYPADHYILILNGHGHGWMGICSDETSYKISNTGNSLISLSELNSVLSSCLHLDILFLEACHMGQIEVFYELKDHADIVLAGESFMAVSPPMIELPLKNLTNNPELAPVEIAQMFVDNYNPSLFYEDVDWWCPLFGIKSKHINNITQAIDNLTEAIINQYSSDPIKTRLLISKAFKHSTMYWSGGIITDDMISHDLYRFTEEIHDLSKNKMPNVYNAAKEVISVVDNSSIIKHSNKSNEDYHGIAIFSPPRKLSPLLYYYSYILPFLILIPKISYKSLEFAKDNSWDDLLDIMYPLRKCILNICN